MNELKPCPCIHGSGRQNNSIGEEVVFCELTAEWMNVTLGDCLGNCEAQNRRVDNECIKTV